MAERTKGINIQIGGDTVGLSKALSGVNKQINSTKNDLKDVERLLKLDPTNTTLLEQKQKLLKQAVGETSAKLKTLEEAQKQLDDTIKSGGTVDQRQYDALSREIIATKGTLEDLETQAQNSNVALQKISLTADKIGSAADTVASKTSKLSAAAAGGIAAIGAMAYKAVAGADDLNTLATQSGFTTEQLQEMSYASDLVDVSVETITGAATKMRRNMASTSKDTVAAWQKIGVSVTDANGNLRDSNTVFYEAIKGLSGISNETERDTLAMQIFGKSADELAGIIDDGGASLQSYGQQAKDAGMIMSQDTVDGLNKVNDKIDVLKAKVNGTLAKSGGKAVEAFMPVINDVIDKIDIVLQKIGAMSPAQIKMIGTILLVVAAISPVAKIVGGIAGAVKGVTAAIGAVNGGIAIFSGAATTGSVAAKAIAGAIGLITSPIFLAVAGIVAFIAIIAIWGDKIQAVLRGVDNFMQAIFVADWTNIFGPVLGNVLNAFFANVKNIWDSIVLVFNGVIDIIRGVFTGDWTRAWEGVIEVFSGIFGGLLAIAKAPINGIIGLLNAAVGAVNTLINGFNGIGFTMPSWLGGESWYPSIPNIPSIPYLAKGGVLSGGSAIVGDAGPELLTLAGGAATVTPLSGGKSGGSAINFTANFYGDYKHSDGLAAARDLNRVLGRMCLT